jgi:hypothetical protein
MPTISVTRLHVRSFRFIVPFVVYALRSARQAARAPGFAGGRLDLEPALGFWTVTVWDADASMREFRNSGVHRRAMPKLLNWCDEASYIHWQQDGREMPSIAEAHRRLLEAGRLSKVLHPSATHAGGRTATNRIPRPGRVLNAR